MRGRSLCSYLLINFWHTRLLANKAALKAMIMNRIADIVFSFGIVLMLVRLKTTDYVIIFNLVPLLVEDTIVFGGFHFSTLTLLSFFLVIGAIGKSAQLGLHT